MRKLAFYGLFPALAALAAACASNDPIKCDDSSDCSQAGIGGECLGSPESADMWCAFPDSACEGSELRWGILSGDGLARECVGVQDGPDGGSEMVTVSVALSGAGMGTVTSSPAGIDCPGTCSATFVAGTELELTAVAQSGSFFEGWTAGCTGRASCALTLDAGLDVDATFLLSGATRSLRGFDDFRATLRLADGTFAGLGPCNNFTECIQRIGDASPEPVWTTSIVGTTEVFAVTGYQQLSSGDIVVSGTTSIDLTIGGIALDPDSTRFVARLDLGTGTVKWARGFGGVTFGAAAGQLVAVGPDDKIYMAANFIHSIVIDGTVIQAPGTNNRNIYLVSLDSEGTILWSRGGGGPGVEFPQVLAVGADGHPLLLGGTETAIDFGTGATSSIGGFDCFFAKFASSTGTTLFAEMVGSTGSDSCLLLAAGSAGFAVALEAAGPVVAGTSTVAGAGFVVLNYTAAGSLASQMRIDSATTEFRDLLIAPGGSIWLTGFYDGSVSMGGTSLPAPPAGKVRGFLAQFSSGGAHLRSMSFGGAQSAGGDRIFGTETSITTTGSFQGICEFPGGSLTSDDAEDGFAWSIVP